MTAWHIVRVSKYGECKREIMTTILDCTRAQIVCQILNDTQTVSNLRNNDALPVFYTVEMKYKAERE